MQLPAQLQESQLIAKIRAFDTTQETLDRLSVVSIVLGAYFFIIWLLPLQTAVQRFATHGSVLSLGVAPFVGLALLQILRPGRFCLTVLNSAIFICFLYLPRTPVASNNQTMGMFMALIVLVTFLAVEVRGGESTRRETVFVQLAQPGRWLLAIMYFFGIFHKINADFLDPTVSCAVELYRRLADHIGLADWIVGHYGAIYATFAVEAIAMILLFSHRYKLLGFAIGVPFHIIIGFTGYAFYMDFSTIVLAIYTLFLPKDFVVGIRRDIDIVRRYFRFDGNQIHNMARWCIGLYFTLLFIVTLGLGFFDSRFFLGPYPLMPFFAVFAIGFYILCLRYIPWDGGQGHIRALALDRKWAAILPILFFLNGWSPYFGLKTESSIAMYSNLHTEGGKTNHVLFGQLPFIAGYQNDLVKIRNISDTHSLPKYLEQEGIFLTRYEFERILSRNHGIPIEFEYQGRVQTTRDPWENTYDATPWLLKRYLIFKPVDFNRPKVCTH